VPYKKRLIIEMKGSDSIEVSVITAAYNAAKYIAETIRSVQRQSFTRWEYIIVDNGSTDNTVDIIKEYLSDDRIHLFIEDRKGRGFARNTAVAHATGEYIANIDSDDLWEPDKLEKQVHILRSNPQLGLVYTGLRIINEGGTTIAFPNAVDISRRPLQYLLTEKNPITHSSILLRREALYGDRYQDENIEDADELIVYLRAFLAFKEAGFISEPLTLYRVHRGSGLDRVSICSYCRNYKKGLDTFFQIYSIPKEIRALKRRAYGTMYYLSASVGISYKKEPGTCVKYLLNSAFLRPNRIHNCLYQLVRLLLSPMRPLN
jgi:glycosyltransferase involved in cell wall biosynthesis